jgi:hypothetical protein
VTLQRAPSAPTLARRLDWLDVVHTVPIPTGERQDAMLCVRVTERSTACSM